MGSFISKMKKTKTEACFRRRIRMAFFLITAFPCNQAGADCNRAVGHAEFEQSVVEVDQGHLR